MKRVIDFLLAFSGLVLLAPVLGLLALWISIDSPGGPFFSQVRVGKNGRPFRLWKMRSMRPVAGVNAPVTRGENDPRITSSGRYIRMTKLDELPQLWNVLRGEMSIVGPRPEVPEYVARYTELQRTVLRSLPGLTDPASLNGMDEGERIDAAIGRGEDAEEYYLRTIMPEKIQRQLDYLQKSTVRTDLGVMWETFVKITGLKRR